MDQSENNENQNIISENNENKENTNENENQNNDVKANEENKEVEDDAKKVNSEKETSDDITKDFEILSSDSAQYDYNYKIIIIGDSGVGKTCLTYRATSGEFREF